MTVWTLVADRTQARIFSGLTLIAPLQLKETLENPDGKLKEGELESDRPSSKTQSTPGAHPNMTSSHENAKDHVLDLFSKRIGEHLRLAAINHEFDSLRIAADSQMLGKLKRELDKVVLERTVLCVPKNLIHADSSTILQALDKAMAASEDAATRA